jgi:hypothetical protein
MQLTCDSASQKSKADRRLQQNLRAIASCFTKAIAPRFQQVNLENRATALSVNAEELITTEKASKPIYRVTKIKVISIALNES